jgi:ketosteroid isomerase-like protein
LDHRKALQEYERRLGKQQWAAVEDLIHEEAVFIFSEGTFRGKAEIAQAFAKTFQTIQDEQYSLHDLDWLVVTDDVAACIYNFRWQGIVKGQAMSGGGRGTTILQKTDKGWQIVHEHLGPSPRS